MADTAIENLYVDIVFTKITALQAEGRKWCRGTLDGVGFGLHGICLGKNEKR
jgi:hypothetical protein